MVTKRSVLPRSFSLSMLFPNIYYDLNLSLLTKSITLFFIGIACITAWYFFTQKKNKT